jgi:hypothetical protein
VLFSRRSEGKEAHPVHLVGSGTVDEPSDPDERVGSWTFGSGGSEQWGRGDKKKTSLFVYPSFFGMGLGKTIYVRWTSWHSSGCSGRERAVKWMLGASDGFAVQRRMGV